MSGGVPRIAAAICVAWLAAAGAVAGTSQPPTAGPRDGADYAYRRATGQNGYE